MKALFHAHTKFSRDSLLRPEDIVDFAVARGIDYLFITDHDTIRGSLAARDHALKHRLPVTVVIGSEVRTDIGDVIGIFLTDEIQSRDCRGVIREIHEQGGLAALPHPYQGHDLSNPGWLADVDFVEIFNGRTTVEQDRRAEALRQQLNARPIYGCDAHLKSELSNCLLESGSLEEFKAGRMTFQGRKTTRYRVHWTAAIKAARTGAPLSLLRSLFGAALCYVARR